MLASSACVPETVLEHLLCMCIAHIPPFEHLPGIEDEAIVRKLDRCMDEPRSVTG